MILKTGQVNSWVSLVEKTPKQIPIIFELLAKVVDHGERHRTPAMRSRCRSEGRLDREREKMPSEQSE